MIHQCHYQSILYFEDLFFSWSVDHNLTKNRKCRKCESTAANLKAAFWISSVYLMEVLTSLEVAVIHMRSFFILSNPIILLHAVFCLSDFYVTVTVRVCLVKLFLSNKKERHEVIQSIRYWLFKQKPFCLVSGFFQFLCILRSLFISIYCCACMYLLLLIAVYKPNCLSGTLKCYSALLLSKWCVCVIISCSTWCCWASIFCTQSSFGNASGCSHCGTFWFSNIRVCCHANCGTPSSTRKALCCFCNTFMCMWTVTTQFGMMRNFLVTKHLKVKKNVM